MSGDPAAFAEARLTEDEAKARSDPSLVAWLTLRDEQGQMLYTTVAAGSGEDWDVWCANGDGLPEPASVDVVYDPARLLREVEAGRRILERHRECPTGGGYDEWFAGPGPCPDMADLLARWDDHPDYDGSWKPHAEPAGAPS